MSSNKNIILLLIVIIFISSIFYILLSKINSDINTKIYKINSINKVFDTELKNIKEKLKKIEISNNTISKTNIYNTTNTSNSGIIDNKIVSNTVYSNIEEDNKIKNNLLDSVKNNNLYNKEVIKFKKISFDSKLKLCNNLSIINSQLECKNDLYYAQAIYKLDNSFCNKIKDNSHNVEVCIKKINILKIRNSY